MFDRSKKGEHALLIQPHFGKLEDDVLEEFGDLARSAGASIAATITARLDRPNPSTLIGSGKLDEIKAAADASGADLILVNHALSPARAQPERFLERRVIDRTGLILTSSPSVRTATKQAAGRTGAAAPPGHAAGARLDPSERQRGGSIGLRGPGETQLETDRRLLQKRVEQLQKRLKGRSAAHPDAPCACAASCRAWPWWATPTPASRPCSTP
jgi:GTP-binding protein HflX